jgi:hypothetical protein
MPLTTLSGWRTPDRVPEADFWPAASSWTELGPMVGHRITPFTRHSPAIGLVAMRLKTPPDFFQVQSFFAQPFFKFLREDALPDQA